MDRKFIVSTAFTDCFMSVDGSSVKRFEQGGSGSVNCQAVGGTWEYLSIINLPGGNGKVAIRPTAFSNVYLRMYPSDNQVNCQYGQGELEEFYLRSQPGDLWAIESAAYPGRYLTINGKSGSNGKGFGFVSVANKVDAWERFKLIDLPSKPNIEQLRGFIGSYGPQLRLYSKENYLPCTVDFILSHATLKSKSGGDIYHPTVDQLPTRNSGKDQYWLDIEKKATYGDLANAKAYVHAFSPNISTYVDLQFWFCYGFNGPASIAIEADIGLAPINKIIKLGYPSVSPVGEHWGDWECCILRVSLYSKNWVGAWLSQHDSGQWFDKFQIGRFRKPEKKNGPVVYVSNNGHALYSETGDNILMKFREGIAGLFQLQGGLYNVCGDGGPSLDCSSKYEIVATSWPQTELPRAKWLDYPYRWGPTGGTPYDISPIVNGIFDTFPSIARITGMQDALTKIIGQVAKDLGDNVDGPEGPADKDQFNGKYN